MGGFSSLKKEMPKLQKPKVRLYYNDEGTVLAGD